MKNSIFNELLTTAKKQAEKQRLLFLFAPSQTMNQNMPVNHQSGTINPLMCVDKLPSELSTFEDFVKEADAISPKWDMVFIAGLGGQNGNPPTSKDADPHLTKMSNDLAFGGDLSRYVILNRNEQTITIG